MVRRLWCATRTVFALALPIALMPLAAASQEADDGPWKVDGELGASLFFGVTDQTTLALRSNAERATDALEFSLGLGFAYGESQEPGSDNSFVSKRSWNARASADYRPEARVSPFVFVGGEGSLERQIDLRIDAGAGGKVRLVDSESGNLDASLAALVERTDPRLTPARPDAEAETLGRWSARLRARKAFADDRTVFNLVTFYRPAFGDFDDYTVDLETSLAYALNGNVSVKVSFVDTYDSLAESRGASSNNDGRLFVSLLATAG